MPRTPLRNWKPTQFKTNGLRNQFWIFQGALCASASLLFLVGGELRNKNPVHPKLKWPRIDLQSHWLLDKIGISKNENSIYSGKKK